MNCLCILLLGCSNAYSREWEKPSTNKCSFYESVENDLKCLSKSPSSDYLINYGLHYCKIFQENKKLLSPKGQEWTEKTTKCLQEMLKDNRLERITPCNQLENFAFDAHPICYKQYRICDLNDDDKLQIINNVEFLDIVKLKSILQGMNVGINCLAELITKKILDSIKKITLMSASLPENERIKIANVITRRKERNIKDREEYLSYAVVEISNYNMSYRLGGIGSASEDAEIVKAQAEKVRNDCESIEECQNKLDTIKNGNAGVFFPQAGERMKIDSLIRKLELKQF